MKSKEQLAQDIEDLLACFFDAHVEVALGGIGGTKHFELEGFPAKYRKYILQYLKADTTSSGCLINYLSDNGYLK